MDKNGIPGKIKGIEWGNWVVEDQKTKEKIPKTGLIVHVEGWQFPVKYSVKTDPSTGGYQANCAGAKFLGSLVTLGVLTKEQVKSGLDTDALVGRNFLWAKQKLYEDFDAKLTVPIYVLDGDHEDAANATGTGGPADFIVRKVEAAQANGGITLDGMMGVLVTAHGASEDGSDTAMEFWSDPSNKAKLLETRLTLDGNGKLKVRAATAPAPTPAAPAA